MGYAKFILLTLVVVASSSCRTPTGDAPQSYPADGPKTNPLEGKWQVSSASYQLAGHMYYTFSGDTLEIERQSVSEKLADALPLPVSITKWRFRIDEAMSPPRLILTGLDQPGTLPSKETYAFEFRKDGLWLCRDDGGRITTESLRPANGGWVTRLSRLSERE
jgi:hypothetical protein